MPGLARVIPKYPAKTNAGPGLSATRANGEVTYALDIDALDEISDLTGLDLTQTFVAAVLDDGTYRKVAIQTIIDAAP